MRPASAPLTAEAAAAGELGADHVDAIAEAMNVLPADLADDERAGYESTLVELARQATPAQVRRAGRRIAALVDQDREPQDKPDPDLAEPQRELRWWWSRRNRFKFTGELDYETGTLLETLLSALAKPRPSVAGDRDPRDTGQRQGDAFAELLEFAHRATGRPTEAGEAPVVIVTMTLEQLRRRDPLISAADTAHALREADRQTATLNWDSPITAEQARRLACDANLVPAVLGGTGEVLDLGRQARTASRAQRRALALRDRGCIMCARPVRWTQVHHNDEWDAHHGPTDIDNLCLLCGSCHRMVHHGGWQIRLNADRLPEVIPPAWVDPHRRPRRFTGAHIEPLS